MSIKISDTSPIAYLLFTFIAMTGLSYINFLPGVVNALAIGIGFSDVAAGQVVALNGYGGILGTLGAIFLVRRVSWRRALFTLLTLLTAIDLSTILIESYSAMLGWRFLAGVTGGLCVGIAFSVLARLNNPDRAFGLLLFIQFSIGSIVIYLLPMLEQQFGVYAVFYIMASFSGLSLLFLIFVPDVSSNSKTSTPVLTLSEVFGNTLLLMLAIMLYQCAASAIWAYVGLIGLGAGMEEEAVNTSIAITGLLGLLGAMLPVISGNRFGRLYWIIVGVALSLLSTLMLSTSPLNPLIYNFALALLFVSWPAVQSYLLAVTAEMDNSGQLSTLAAVVSSVGLATGPLIASSLLDNGSFSLMLYGAAMIFLMSLFFLYKPVRLKEKQRKAQLATQ